MATEKRRILLSGMIAGVPCQGGATWAVLQYLLGFQRLGHRVTFVEPVRPSSLRPIECPFQQTANATYFKQVIREFGLEGHAALLQTESQETVGLPYDKLCQAAQRCDILVNISGMLALSALSEKIPVRVYLDLD